MDHRRKGTMILSSLLEDLVCSELRWGANLFIWMGVPSPFRGEPFRINQTKSVAG